MNKRFPQILLIFALLLSSVILLPQQTGAGQEGQGTSPTETPWPFNLFLPFTSGEKGGYRVAGQVVDAASQPVAGVTISDDWGSSVVTDAQGRYQFATLRGGEHALAASKDGYFFAPSVQEVTVGAGTTAVDFVASAASQEILTNLSFEDGSDGAATGWVFPSSELTAKRTNAGARTGSYSVFTGYLGGSTVNPYAYSSVRTNSIHVPDNAANATLTVWAFPLTTEKVSRTAALKTGQLAYKTAPLAYDAHYVQVLSTGAGNPVLETLMWDLYDNPLQQWRVFTFNLSKYAGQNIIIDIGTFNDGYDGISAMYVDDVSLAYTTTGGNNTQAPTAPEAACENILSNPGFESTGSWRIRNSHYPATYSGVQVRSGTRSMSTGIPIPQREELDGIGYSEVYQDVELPDNVTGLYLNLFFLPQLGVPADAKAPVKEGEPAYFKAGEKYQPEAVAESPDYQYFYILDEDDNVIFSKAASWGKAVEERVWTPLNVAIPLKYAGEEVRILFGTFNDGASGSASMYVDDVALNSCTAGSTPATSTATPGVTATPVTATPVTATPATATATVTTTPGTATPLPSNCDEEIINNGFESNKEWFIPLTEYSAGYSRIKVASGERSMRAGIWYASHNRYSYSDFRQDIRIPWDVDSAWLTFDMYSKSTEWRNREVPQLLETQSPVYQTTMVGDVQYLLVMDRWLNWVDTLMWDRFDEREWVSYEANMRYFRGDNINLQFGVYNDGWDGVTSMFVDNVSLVTCQ